MKKKKTLASILLTICISFSSLVPANVIFAEQSNTTTVDESTESKEPTADYCPLSENGHTFEVDSGIVASKATCSKAETHYLMCSCGYNPKSTKYTVSVGKNLTHVWVKNKKVVLKTGTCNGKTNGYYIYQCKLCGAKKKGTTWNNAVDHKAKYVGKKSCHTKCKYCGKTMSTKHTYNVKSGVVYTYATTKSAKKCYYKCECGYNPKSSKYVYSSGKKLSSLPTSFKLSVPYLAQNPSFPNGCEAVSLTSTLNYLGYNVSARKIIYSYLPMGRYGSTNPYYAFIGDPGSSSGWGCFAPAIVKTANSYLKDYGCLGKDKAINVSHTGFENLAEYYLLKYHRPVVVWGSVDMQAFRFYSIPIGGGDYMTWRGHNHCLVLIGWDKYNYIFMDPMRGIRKYSKKTVETRYKQNDKQAVFIMPQN